MKKAKRIASDHNVDVTICDVNLPDGNGPVSYTHLMCIRDRAMYAQTYGIILAVVIGFLAAGIFADEFRTKAEAVFFLQNTGDLKQLGINF